MSFRFVHQQNTNLLYFNLKPVTSKMLKNILCTSRWLARRQVISVTPVLLRHYPRVLSKVTSLSFDRQFSSKPTPEVSDVNPAVYEKICNETLESLCEYFEEIVDDSPNLNGADVTFSDGVLTVALGSEYGTYVINRQTPNKQIWLSSPVSGPKRYDLILKNGGYWVYKHDGMSLHKLLQEEISKIVKSKVEFNKCSHSLV